VRGRRIDAEKRRKGKNARLASRSSPKTRCDPSVDRTAMFFNVTYLNRDLDLREIVNRAFFARCRSIERMERSEPKRTRLQGSREIIDDSNDE